MTNPITPEQRRLAAISRSTPMGSRDGKGRLLPLRYRAAEKLVARAEQAAASKAYWGTAYGPDGREHTVCVPAREEEEG